MARRNAGHFSLCPGVGPGRRPMSATIVLLQQYVGLFHGIEIKGIGLILQADRPYLARMRPGLPARAGNHPAKGLHGPKAGGVEQVQFIGSAGDEATM